MEIEKEEEKEVIKEEKSNLKNLIKWLGVVFLPFTWIAFFVILYFTEISFLYPFLISMGLSVLWIVMIFNVKIAESIKKFKKRHEEKEIPDPISEQELKEKIKNILTNLEYRDHIKEYKNMIPYNVGKNLIYHCQIRPLYNELDCHIIINANYPQRQPAIFYNTKPSDIKLRKAINAMSTNPLPEPDVEKTQIYNPLIGSYQTMEKKIHKKKKPPEQKEDLI